MVRLALAAAGLVVVLFLWWLIPPTGYMPTGSDEKIESGMQSEISLPPSEEKQH